jgi:hypothetical protein
MGWLLRVTVGATFFGAAFLPTAFFVRAPCLAQAPAPQPQVATTVQLPTFSVFTVQTTVSVPDGGTMSLGGIGRGADSGVNRGPIRNRALGSARSASGVSISATIIDTEEIDRALLAEAAAKREFAADAATAKRAADLSKSVARVDDRAALPGSVAAIRQRNAAAAEEQAAELAGYFAQASQAEAEGKLAVAKIYYQMVARRDRGQLQERARQRLAALGAPSRPASRR